MLSIKHVELHETIDVILLRDRAEPVVLCSNCVIYYYYESRLIKVRHVELEW